MVRRVKSCYYSCRLLDASNVDREYEEVNKAKMRTNLEQSFLVDSRTDRHGRSLLVEGLSPHWGLWNGILWACRTFIEAGMRSIN